MLTAWGDESQSSRTLDPGTYILASAITLDRDLDAMRQAMGKLLSPGAKKVRWHDDRDVRHREVVDRIAGLPVEGFVVVRCVAGDRAERSRRKCLATMLAELQALGCSALTLESRGRADNQRDMEMARHLKRQRHPGAAVRLFHEVGPKEPLLWIADTLCGAVMAARCGRPEFLDRLADRVRVQVVEETA